MNYRNQIGIAAIIIILFSSTFAGATTITFNNPDFANQPAFNQYSSDGVTFAGGVFTSAGLLHGIPDIEATFDVNVNEVSLDYKYNFAEHLLWLQLYDSDHNELASDSLSVVEGTLSASSLTTPVAYALIHDSGHDFFIHSLTFHAVPEPGTLILLGSGLVGTGLLRMRRKKSKE